MSVSAEFLLEVQQPNSPPPKPEVVLRKLFEALGATYIKLGQFIASSPTLFPEEYVMEFQKCLDKADPIPFSTIQQIIKAELGQAPEAVFSSIDPVPLASASVAQVHSAVLRSSNQEVVLKVLKPGVEDILTTDLSFIYVAAKVLEFISPSLARTSLSGIIGDIRNSMMEEVDFTKEAAHIQVTPSPVLFSFLPPQACQLLRSDSCLLPQVDASLSASQLVSATQEFARYLDKSGARGVATCPFVYKDLTSK